MKDKLISYQQRMYEARQALSRIINNYSEEPVSWEGCDTLVVFTVSGFLEKNKEEDLTWWTFLAMRREAPSSTRSKYAARYENRYFIPYSQYKAGAVEPDLFKRIVFVYYSRKGLDDYSEGIWLRKRADEGCMILSNNIVCFKDPDGQKRFEKNSFYLPVMNFYKDILDLDLDRFYDLLYCSNSYKQLQFTVGIGRKGNEYILNKLNALALAADPVVQFYEIIKICEYCIHIRALKSLCADHEYSELNSEKLIHPSFGTVSSLQKSDYVFSDPDLAMDARLLDMLLTGKHSSSISCLRVSYLQLCELIVRLRNRYLGHGIMSGKATFRMMKPLSKIMNLIVREFAGSDLPDQDDYLFTSFDGTAVPAVRIHQDNTYYFCGFYQDDSGWYADYMCFVMGLSIRCSLNDFIHPVLIAEQTAEDPEAGGELHNLPEEKPFIPVLSGEARKSFVREMHHMAFMPIVYDRIGDDYYTSLTGTPNYSDYSVNLIGVYDQLTVAEMPLEEFHHLLLGDRHPAYIAQYDREHIENENWTEDTFGESVFLNTVHDGLLLPQCKTVLAVCGADPERVVHPYPWIRNTFVAGFRDRHEYDLWRASFSTNMMYEFVDQMMREIMGYVPEKKKVAMIGSAMTEFGRQSRLYEKLLTEYSCKSILRNSDNIYFAGMLKNALDAPNLELSFISLFDFIEFAVLAVIYSSFAKNHLEPASPRDLTNVAVGGEVLLMLAEKYDNPALKGLGQMRIPVSGRLRELHQKSTRYIPVRLDGSTVSFLKTCEILRYLRNRTKGHGFIQPANAADLWQLAMHYTMILIRFLHLDSFAMEYYKGKPEAGYLSEEYLYYVDYFYYSDGNMPCPLVDARNGMNEYLNYFTGEKFAFPKSETQD